MIYMFQAGGANGPVKIGHADDPASRLIQCQVGNHLELRMLRLFEGGEAEERVLHERFVDLWVRGEWHGYSRSMLGDLGLVEIPLPESPDFTLTWSQELLLAEVTTFMHATSMGATTLGILAVNDGKFVARLRSGKNMQTRTVERVRDFMAGYARDAA